MAKYLFIYRMSAEQEQKQPSPEEMQAIMGQWGQWFQSVGEGMVDGGDGLLPSGKLVDGNGAVTDGPFIEAKDLVGGFSIVQGDSYDKAVEYAKTCPIVAQGGTVEIRELAGYGEALS